MLSTTPLVFSTLVSVHGHLRTKRVWHAMPLLISLARLQCSPTPLLFCFYSYRPPALQFVQFLPPAPLCLLTLLRLQLFLQHSIRGAL